MGLGKTAQLIRACDLVQAERVTVVCPAILLENWRREYGRFSYVGLPVMLLRTGKDKVPAGPSVVIVSDALVHSDKVRKQLLDRAGDVLIIDEAHRVKDRRAQRTKATLGKWGLCHKVEHTWLSSGTPALNHAGEMYPFCVAAGLWKGPYDAPVGSFVLEYCETVRTQYGLKILGNRNADKLRALMAPVLLRRTLDDVPLDLPELLEPQTLYVQGDAKLLQDIEPETLEAIEHARLTGDWSLRETPAIATARRIIGAAKAGAVADLAKLELDAGLDRLLIFGIHRSFFDVLARELAAYGVGLLNGDTPKPERERLVNDFQNPAGTTRILLCQITVAGAGLNLTAASRVMMGEWAWTPAENDQAIARSHRRGQTRPVRVSYVSIAGSVDGRVSTAEGDKRKRLLELY